LREAYSSKATITPHIPKLPICSNDVATPAYSGKKEHASTGNECAIEAHRKQP